MKKKNYNWHDSLEKRIKELQKHFGVYGYGNFDLTTLDILKLLKAIKADDYKQCLKKLYVKLEKQRMG